MSAPDYAWTCQGCNANIDAGRGQCNVCGLPANFTARQLAEIKPRQTPENQTPEKQESRSNGLENVLLFIPEAPIALICVCTSPGRIWDMAQHGNVFAALLQFLVTVGTATGVYFALVSKQRWLIYIALVAYIGFVAIASK